MISLTELSHMYPLLIVAAGVLVTLVLDMFIPSSKKMNAWLTVFILLTAGYVSLFQVNTLHIVFNGMAAVGGAVNILFFLYCFTGAIIVLFSMDYIQRLDIDYGEFYILLLSSVLGMMLISAARDFIMIFIGLEQMSVCFYILTGFRRRDSRSNEAAIKYFLLGSFATGFIVYGMALIYGSAASLNLDFIKMNIATLSGQPFFLAGMLLFIIGFTFKIAAVPFHSWAPDVYQGAPTPVTALMATTGKAAAFSALLLVLAPMNVNAIAQKIFVPFLAVIALLSMVYGSIVALRQSDVKRMLAYSSIAHAGYILMGVASASSFGQGSVIFYLIVYAFMNIGAFGLVSMLEQKDGKFLSVHDYSGFAERSPAIAALLSVFLFALSGLPPFAGFFAKYFVFIAAVKSDLTWLAIFGALSSAVSVYFYLRIIVLMYFKTGESAVPPMPAPELSKTAYLGVMITIIIFIAISLYPSTFYNLLFLN